ncbi:protein MpUGT16 [Marchantia polymorpha subsp. ruderalis]|uniref:Glycosyltransferase n=2 Tax=Marchantia polymorpha TaxID=3197 RepID=A0A176WEB5_MARPO|nr:hypothetical protein AXG93_3415s1100 [Marchantia polymorpha subsp. ruderalis]PTQ30412.1 hypothetical protein MARPO_0125s0041 [Marchantia polymorpha]BBN07878.1 hypothetical protein Mp_4g06960 [Marchantia polymorpha subsp. ruderalis]|eukprot:PTQ30412.1 hypothetical protein MARPO_0125s0041 [Marchantia polymorpha]
MENYGEQGNFTNCETEIKASPNVWIMPFPWFSHIASHLNVAKQLAKFGLTVTFFVPENDEQRLIASGHVTPDRWTHEGLDIRIHRIKMGAVKLGYGDNDGSPSSPEKVVRVVDETENAYKKELGTILASELAPSCLIADLWLPRVREFATQHDILSWAMCTFSTIYVAGAHYVHHLIENGFLLSPPSYKDPKFQNEGLSLPGLAFCPFEDLPSGFSKGAPTFNCSARCALSMEKSDVILLPSFKELDGRVFSEFERHLRASAARNYRKAPRLLTIGPTFPILSPTSEGGEEERFPVLKFLDSQQKSSVLYVAFGGDGCHSREQIVEIVHGLENSQRPFVCVLLPPLKTADVQTDDVFSVIPADCIERTKGRGMFVQRWAPQMKVLAHPSTGGFLSHFGFNSMMESVCLGVPLLAWPLFAEQKLTARWAVDEAKIALEVGRGPGDFVDRKEVERSVRTLFDSEEGRAVKKRVSELKEMAKEAAAENGSSWKNLKLLVDLVRDERKGQQSSQQHQHQLPASVDQSGCNTAHVKV